MVLYEQPLVLDEVKYTFAIPKGTKQISIMQKELGKKNNYHRVSLQQAFLYAGDYNVTETSLDGFPVKVTDLEYEVHTPLAKNAKLYYNVTPKGLRMTNTVEVVGNGADPQGTQQLETAPTQNVQKVFENGALIIIRDGVKYSVMGQRL